MGIGLVKMYLGFGFTILICLAQLKNGDLLQVLEISLGNNRHLRFAFFSFAFSDSFLGSTFPFLFFFFSFSFPSCEIQLAVQMGLSP